MPQLVSMGATLKCSFGTSPSSLIVAPPLVSGEGPPAANIMDCAPIANIPPFGMCRSLANPTVAAATAANKGTLTPMPCVPVTSPWKPGAPAVLLRGQPALHKACTCQCAFAGIITIQSPATSKEQIG